MSAKCGTCGKRHSAISEYRACAQGKAPAQPQRKESVVISRLRRGHDANPFYADAAERGSITTAQAVRYSRNEARREQAPAPAWATNPATPGARKYALDRLNLREWSGEGALDWELSEAAMDLLDDKPIAAPVCSRLIDALGALPYKRRDPVASKIAEKMYAEESPAPSAPQAPSATAYAAQVRALKAQVPDGRYAANINGSKLRFFLIKTGRTGKISISEYASDALYPRKWSEYLGIMEQVIEDGTEAAGRRFGEEMGMCRKCGRALTDEDNSYKVFGYGPDCGPRVMG